MITKVTLTGADDNTNPFDLIQIAEEYPYAEFGILISQRSISLGQKIERFPSLTWIEKLNGEVSWQNSYFINCTLHVCGKWVKQIFKGKMESDLYALIFMSSMQHHYKRWQLNTHGLHHDYDKEGFWKFVDQAKSHNQNIIFQYDNANNDIIRETIERDASNIDILFDLSHGAGVLPSEWPPLIRGGITCGYAGGLSPENVAENIEKIFAQPNFDPQYDNITIDAETHLRTNGQFDLDKCAKFLEATKPYIKK
jgi:hypothetical protein